MAVFTIAGLTLKEAVRRRTLLGAMVMGLLVLGISLILFLIYKGQQDRLAHGRISPEDYATRMVFARSAIQGLCLSSIKSLGAVFAALLAGGAVSGEIERGLLAVILPRPIYRWQILLGKWIGLNLILIVSTFVWTATAWLSLTLQTHRDLTPMLRAAPYLALFPVLLSTLTLTLSAIVPRLFGTTLALTLGALAWFDGILNTLGEFNDVPVLNKIADWVGLIVPQGYVGWWVEGTMAPITNQGPRGSIGTSPQFLTELGKAHLHFAHLDAVYIACYIVFVFLIGVVLFQRRDI